MIELHGVQPQEPQDVGRTFLDVILDRVRRALDELAGHQHLVRVLSAILRVAIGLDRSHDHRVASTRCRREPDGIVIEVIPAGMGAIELELFATDQRRGLLEEVLGCPVALEAAH